VLPMRAYGNGSQRVRRRTGPCQNQGTRAASRPHPAIAGFTPIVLEDPPRRSGVPTRANAGDLPSDRIRNLLAMPPSNVDHAPEDADGDSDGEWHRPQ